MLIKSDLNCDIGCVRQNNEDMILLGEELFRDKAHTLDINVTKESRFAAIVADGMGGYNSGEIASEFGLTTFRCFVHSLPEGLSVEEITEKIKEWAQTTHRDILTKGIEGSEYKGMGTTFCGMLFYENLILALNIGDSRLYRFRNGILRQLSIDHSERQRTGDQSLPSNLIYNSLGAGKTTFIDVDDLTERIFDEDIFLVCSDGLCDMISDDEIEKILFTQPTTDKLIEAAKRAGGKDNVSCILLIINKIQYNEL